MSDTKLFTSLGYSSIPLNVWMHAARHRDTVPGLFDPDLDEWKRHMRSLIPLPWHYRGRIEVATILTAGQRVKVHPHPEWTLVYYPHVAETSKIEIEGVIYPVDKDCAMLIPPHIMHGVPPTVEDLRYSVAFRVFDHDNWTLPPQ